MIIYLSLGSNIHPRHDYISRALSLIGSRVGRILVRSSDFYSMPQGYDSQSEYLNIAVKAETDLQPLPLLDVTEQIEKELFRTVKNHYADRTIDIDILYYIDDHGRQVQMQTDRLTLPHPRIWERDFVLVPLKEISDSAV